MEFFTKMLGLPVLASEHGKDVDKFIIYVHLLMILLFVGWGSFFLYTLWRFNRKRNPKADHVGVKNHASTYLEGAVALVEAILLVAFAIPLWAKVVDSEKYPNAKDATVLRLTAQQFAWQARYPGPDGVFGRQDKNLISSDNKLGYDPDDTHGRDDFEAAFNEVVVPVDKPVIIHLTSMDVIHSFSVHPMRICQDAMPGMSIPLHFLPKMEGDFMITCAQLCGNSHFSMKGILRVVSQKDYDAWLLSKVQAPPAAAGAFE